MISADPTWVEADLELLDERGAVVLAVEGLQIGSGSSESANRQRLLNERLLTIEWQKRELPEPSQTEAGNWLLISTSSGADVVANALTDALKVERAQTDEHGLAAGSRPLRERAAARRAPSRRCIQTAWWCSPARRTATPMMSPQCGAATT